MRVLPGPTKSNQALAWSPDGRFVVAGGTGDGVMVWDVAAGAPGRRVLAAGHGGRLMQFCPRTGRLFVAFQNGGFCHWDPDTDAEHQHRWSAGYYNVYGMAVSADGRAAVVPHQHNRRRELAAVRIGDGGSALRASRVDNLWVDRLAFRPGTDQLFGLGRRADGRLRFEWMPPDADTVAGSILVPPEGGRVTRWALSPDGGRVAWLTNRGLFLRGLDDPAALELPAADGEVRRGLAFHPSGRTLAYTTGPTVRLLDADTLAEVRALDWGTGNTRAVCFSPDGLRAAVSAEGGRGWVTVFDLE